jgi:ribosomal protein RSM22 (predicted rRNA methylase)
MIPAVATDIFRKRLETLEAWLWGEGGRKLGLTRGDPTPHRIAARVEELSDLYTTRRSEMETDAGNAAHLSAKALYFLASDAPKVHFILAELAARYGGENHEALRAIDLGAGVGATAAGLLLTVDAARCPAVELHGIDADPQALRIWQAVVHESARIAGVRVETHTFAHDLLNLGNTDPPRPFDLCLAQSVVNELPFEAADADRLRAEWIAHWASRGPTVVVEPALRVTTRSLHAARDRLLAEKKARVLAPCPHQERCPMLASGKRDWCHETRLFAPTPRVAEVQKVTRRRDERTKFSFVVMAPIEGGPPLNAFTETSGRLVSDALNSKGKMERTLCNGRGEIIPLRLLDRDRSENNVLLANAERGRLVQVTGELELPRVSRHTNVLPAPAGVVISPPPP